MTNQNEMRSIVGVDSVYIAFLLQDDQFGYVADAPQYLAPAMEIKSTPSSASETQYADNGPYDQVSAEGDTELELTAPNFAEPLLAALKGAVVDVSTGRIFDNADPSKAPYFALGYRFKKSNGKYRYRWYLKARVEPSGEEGQSQSDAVNLKSQTMKIRALKTIHKFDLKGDGSLVDGVKRVHGDDDTDNFDADGWFDTVQMPLVGTPPEFDVVTTFPVHEAVGVLLDTKPMVVFSNPLAAGCETGIVLVDSSDRAVVPVSRSLDNQRKVVLLTPMGELTANSSYDIVIHDVMDVYGQTLVNGAETISFEMETDT